MTIFKTWYTNMEKYVTNIKDLAIQTLTNGKEIKRKADSGDPTSCFQMGLIYLFGINTQIDFKKSSQYFDKQSLRGDPEAKRLLGFIAECDGDYSLAFDNYAKANGENNNCPFYKKVYEEREKLRSSFNKMGLPQRALNNVITTILEEYNKKKSSQLSASIKLAVICKDKQSYLEVAQNYSDDGDFSSAIGWLKKANADSNSTLYTTILNKIEKSSLTLKESKDIQPIEIEGTSLLSECDISTTFTAAINAIKEIPSLCRDIWRRGVTKKIKPIKDKWEKEEKRKKEQEKAEYNAYLKQQEEEEANRKKRNKLIIKHAILCVCLFLMGYGAENAAMGIAFIIGFYGWYFPIKWVIKLLKK